MRDLAQPLAARALRGEAPWIEVLSGLGEKGPACIRLWTGRRLWLLDAGFGPEASSPFRPEWLEGADEVFISHDHIDHIGGAAHVIRAGLPIACTAQTARALPPGANLRLLPEQGTTLIDGVALTTGRNGHALGGVWMHFALGQGGLFYSGDWSEESRWFAFDPPPAAATALIDCSYHRETASQEARRAALDAMLAGLDPAAQVLFPVPPSGRAGELALHLMTRGEVTLDDPCREAIAAGLASGGVAPGAEALRPLLARPFNPKARFLLCDTPNADAGMAWRVVQGWRDRGVLGRQGVVVFTGHMTAHARAIAAHGGHFLRWNVHPPLGDQMGLLARIGARRFAPLFCAAPEDYLLETGGAAGVGSAPGPQATSRSGPATGSATGPAGGAILAPRAQAPVGLGAGRGAGQAPDGVPVPALPRDAGPGRAGAGAPAPGQDGVPPAAPWAAGPTAPEPLLGGRVLL